MELPGIPWGQLTPGVLLGIAVLLVLLGRLKPKSDVDKADETAEKWRLAYEAEREARATSDAQTAELLELAKTTHSIVLALFGSSGQIYQSGGGTGVVSSKKD